MNHPRPYFIRWRPKWTPLHFTARLVGYLELVATGTKETHAAREAESIEADMVACTGLSTRTEKGIAGDLEQAAVVTLEEFQSRPFTVPTCDRCKLLYDAACEGKLGDVMHVFAANTCRFYSEVGAQNERWEAPRRERAQIETERHLAQMREAREAGAGPTEGFQRTLSRALFGPPRALKKPL